MRKNHNFSGTLKQQTEELLQQLCACLSAANSISRRSSTTNICAYAESRFIAEYDVIPICFPMLPSSLPKHLRRCFAEKVSTNNGQHATSSITRKQLYRITLFSKSLVTDFTRCSKTFSQSQLYEAPAIRLCWPVGLYLLQLLYTRAIRLLQYN